MGQENFAKPAQILGKGKLCFKEFAGFGEGNGGQVAAHQLGERAAKEIAQADTKGGDGQAGNILIGAQGNGHKAIDQAQKHRKENRNQQRKQNRQKGIHIGNIIAAGIFIKERTDHTAEGATIHNAGDTQIQVAGFFG